MSTAQAQPAASGRWLFGPLPDLLLGCGGLYVLAFLAHGVAGPSLRAATPGYLLPLLILLLSSPHYGATLLRVYEQRQDRRAYAIFSVWTSVALGLLFLFTLSRPLIGSIFFTLYLTWSPWHYSGQNYGLAVMFLGRRGVAVGPRTKRWLHASFQLSFLLAALVMHLQVGAAYSPVEYEGTAVTFLPVGITRGFGDWLLPVVGLAYLASVVVSAVLLRRVGRWRDLAPTASLMLTQALWFAAPFSVQYWGWQTGIEPLDAQRELRSYLLMIFVGHGIQYLWVTTYYARAGSRWSGYGRYWLKASAAGVAIWTLPAVLLGPTGWAGERGYVGNLALLIATFVNLHHFILDGAIWKLRNSRVAAVLIRSGAEESDSDAQETARSWVRPAVWSAAGLGLVAGLVGFYLKSIDIPRRIQRGDLLGASEAVDWAGRLGADEEVLQRTLASRFERRGDLERALRHARARVALNPHGESYTHLGLLEKKAGDSEAARRSFEAALGAEAAPLDLLHTGLGGLALARGDDAAAAEHFRLSLAARPSATISAALAHLLATSEDPAVRDPAESLSLAERAVADQETAQHLRALAAAYAAGERYEEAVETAARALELAGPGGPPGVRETLGRDLERYRARGG